MNERPMLGLLAALLLAGGTSIDAMTPSPAPRVSSRDAAVLALAIQAAARARQVCATMQTAHTPTDMPAEVVRRAKARGVTILPPSQCVGSDLAIAGIAWKGRTATVAVYRRPCVASYTINRRLGVLGWRVSSGFESCE